MQRNEIGIEPAAKRHVKIMGDAMPVHEALAGLLRRMFQGRPLPVMIAVGGPGGIGKSTLAAKLAAALDEACVLTLDDYKTSRAERAERKLFGPHPEANRLTMLRAHLGTLRAGQPVDKPVYCRQQGVASQTVTLSPGRYVIAEGEVATYRELHDLFDFSIYIDAHWRTQLHTRLNRDIEERGYSPRKAIETFLYSNLLEFETYGAASKNWADVHVHCAEDYSLALDAMCAKVASFWKNKSFSVDTHRCDILEALTNSAKRLAGEQGAL